MLLFYDHALRTVIIHIVLYFLIYEAPLTVVITQYRSQRENPENR